VSLLTDRKQANFINNLNPGGAPHPPRSTVRARTKTLACAPSRPSLHPLYLVAQVFT
jgi:hypothetical protein